MNVAKPPGVSGPNMPEASPSSKSGSSSPVGPERKFADVLSGKNQPPAQNRPVGNPFSVPILDGPGKVSNVGQPQSVGQIQRANKIHAPVRTIEVMGERVGGSPGAPGAVGKDGSMNFNKIADDAFKSETRIDGLIKQAQSGKSFNAQELMGLQIEVFRYSQTVEVISRTTDKLVGAVKQTLQTQV